MALSFWGNTKRRKAKSARAYGEKGRRGAAIRAMPCLCSTTVQRRSCAGRVEAAHVTARGMGGVKGDASDLVPLCLAHHRMASEAGTSMRATFEAWSGLDLRAEADRIAAQLDAELGPEPCYLCKKVGGHEPLCRTVEARMVDRG